VARLERAGGHSGVLFHDQGQAGQVELPAFLCSANLLQKQDVKTVAELKSVSVCNCRWSENGM